jgi:hypothetical protein
MYQLESSYWLTSVIKGLIAKIKHHYLIKASQGPQTIWAILIILSDDLRHHCGVLIRGVQVLCCAWFTNGTWRDRSGDSGLTIAGYPGCGWTSLINILIIVVILIWLLGPSQGSNSHISTTSWRFGLIKVLAQSRYLCLPKTEGPERWGGQEDRR